jgi:hypothetical protein
MSMPLVVEWGKYGTRPTVPGPFPHESVWGKLNPIPDVQSSALGFDTVPPGRCGEMQELQNLIIFLKSNGCDDTNSQAIAINGGRQLAQPGTFVDLSGLTDAQWQAACEAIQEPTQRDKANRA